MINANVLFYISIVLLVIALSFMVAIHISDGMLNEHKIRKIVSIVLCLSLIFIMFSWIVNNSVRRGTETGKYETDYSSVQTMDYEK